MLVFALFIILTTLTPSLSSANDQRPFWTERSSFTFDNELYAVGVASNAASVEAGRQQAFINGMEEIRNYGQVASLDGLLIATQMTFEQPQGNGRVSVWRLLKVSMGELRAVKGSAREIREIRSEAPKVSQTAPITPVRSAAAPAAESPIAPYRFQSVNLPALPQRMVHVINGWTRDSHGLVALDWQQKRDWQVELLKPSELSYVR
jgi:hypothetical protein